MKYWIPERLTPTITQFGHAYLRVDPFHDEHAMERNTSLYLDTANLDFYTSHVESAPDRAKLRIRVYGETPSANSRPSGMAFFEFKRKVRSVIVKRRAGVPVDVVGAIVLGDYQSIPAKMRDADRRNLEAFLYYMTIYQARPAFYVTCVREAYASLHEETDVRMTVDRDVAYQVAPRPDFACNPREWVYLGAPPESGAERMALVELKFRGLAPSWMRELVDLLKMERVGFSKYVTSVRKETEERPLVLAVAASVWT